MKLNSNHIPCLHPGFVMVRLEFFFSVMILIIVLYQISGDGQLKTLRREFNELIIRMDQYNGLYEDNVFLQFMLMKCNNTFVQFKLNKYGILIFHFILFFHDS